MPNKFKITVYGRPASQGSKKAFIVAGHARIRESNTERQEQWYNAVASAAANERTGEILITGPLVLTMKFYFKRPKAHYRSGSKSDLLKDSAPPHHIQKPDLGKIIRCTEDALSAVVWRDDAQVIVYRGCGKFWTEKQERGEITVSWDPVELANYLSS